MTTANPNEFAAILQDPTNFEELKRMPMADFAGLIEVWGTRPGEEGLGLVEILADSNQWDLESFNTWLKESGYEPLEVVAAREVAKAAKVGDWVQYAVPKPPGPTTYATGQVVQVSTTGTLTSGSDKVEGSTDDPAVKVLVWARGEGDKFTRTDRHVVKPESKLRSIAKPAGITKQEIELNQQVKAALQRKVEEHNEEHGGTPSKRATLRMLEASMRRGIGAYKQNPGSVRPSVQSPEQWGYGRVNGLLYALRTGKFKRTPFDRDLLPREHKLSTKKSDLDLYPTVEEAERRADELGCVGHHEHEVDGTVMFMPCSMDDYTRLTGLRHQDADEGDLTLVEAELDLDAELFDTKAEAEARAEALGIRGYHSHEVNGGLMYMPGDTMVELEDALRAEAGGRKMHPVAKAEWSTAYVNDLPDSAFFYIAPGGEKDESGRTTPRSLRKLPFRADDGDIDLPHLRNALARLSQTDMPQSAQDRIRREARRLLEEVVSKSVLKAKYDDIDFKPPQGVQEAAELGLALRREHGRGGTLIGVARARDLAGGKTISPDTIKRMVSYFARHEVDLKAPANNDRTDPGYPGAGRIAWLLWGGDPGRRWANKINDQMKREDVAKSQTIDAEVDAVMSLEPGTIEPVGLDHVRQAGPSVLGWAPAGQRYIVTKAAGATEVAPLASQAADNALSGLLGRMPEGTAVEAIVEPCGAVWATDLLMAGGVDLSGIGAALRKALLPTVAAAAGVDTVQGVLVESGADAVLSARTLADAEGDGYLEVKPVGAPYGAVTRLQLQEHRRDLWKFVPPRTVDQPRALIVSGSPNAIEAIRGVPLAGPDGATFKESYLGRLGIGIDDVTVAHACPAVDEQDESWAAWLGRLVDHHQTVPVIALGKQASAALGDREHITFPHPRAVRRRGDRGEIERKAKAVTKTLAALDSLASHNWHCPILKSDDEARIVYGVVLEPDTVDLQGDVLTLDTIENAAHKYLITHRTVGDSHSRAAGAEVVESYLAPADLELGGQIISRGTWIMGVHVTDDDLWQAVKSGDYTGFSIGGVGERKEL